MPAKTCEDITSAADSKTLLLGLTKPEIQAFTDRLGFKKFRASQIASWLYKTPVMSIDEMTNISLEERKKLKEKASVTGLIAEGRASSSEKGTSKYLFKTADGLFTEAVKIGSGAKATICVSSQIGCGLGCAFCATGSMGPGRNLSVDEILAQVVYFMSKGKDSVGNIVFMGMGEPLLNYSNVIRAVKIMNSPEGMGIGIRRITISTCGLPDKIRKLAGEGLDFNIAVSLNAPDDKKRSRLMPINDTYHIREVLKAVDYYIQSTNRRVTFEYVMIKGVNDSIKDAKDLLELLKDRLCHVNLIPFNRFKGSDFEPTTRQRAELFVQILAHGGVNATIRKSRGSDISAACGQLTATRAYQPVYLPAGRQGSVGTRPQRLASSSCVAGREHPALCKKKLLE
ncbi:MAG: 23S rRNA (adenine(2503)-C(2))-methyltransferase RlmN [Candidatus Margulisiibacteriota bacterium]